MATQIKGTQIGNGEITNDQISASANILESKMTLDYSTDSLNTAVGTAQSDATAAGSAASAAQSTADTADGKADTALTNAAAALAAGTGAQSTADGAVTDAGSAQSTADSALALAGTAQGSAQAAQADADTADGKAVAAQADIDALAGLANGKLYIGNGSGVATEVTLSGDITTDNAGVMAIGTGKVEFAMIDSVAVSTDISAGDADKIARADAVKTYVDSVAQGLAVHEPVKAASVATMTLGAGAGEWGYDNGTGDDGVGATLISVDNGTAGNTIDNVALGTGDRFLVKDASDAGANGVYTVTALGGTGTAELLTLTRATDFDNSPTQEIHDGDFFFVQEGDDNGHNGYVQTEVWGTASEIGIGTGNDTDIVWSQFSGAGQITAGAGMTKDGNTLDVVATGDGITASANSIDLSFGTLIGTGITTTKAANANAIRTALDLKSDTHAHPYWGTGSSVSVTRGNGITGSGGTFAGSGGTATFSLDLDGTASGLVLAAGGVKIDLDANSGLALGSGGVSVDFGTGSAQAAAGDHAHGLDDLDDATVGATFAPAGALILSSTGGTGTANAITIDVFNGARTLDVEGDSAINQDVTTDASVTFGQITLDGTVWNDDKITSDGSFEIEAGTGTANSILLDMNGGNVGINDGATNVGAFSHVSGTGYGYGVLALGYEAVTGGIITTGLKKALSLYGGDSDVPAGSGTGIGGQLTLRGGNALGNNKAGGDVVIYGGDAAGTAASVTGSVKIYVGNVADTATQGVIEIGVNRSEKTSLHADGTGTSAIDIHSSGGVLINSDAKTLISADGTGADAIKLDALAGKVLIDAGIGTATDAIKLAATGIAGGIDIDATAGITIDSADDSNLKVDGSGKSLTLEVAGGGVQELILNSAGTGPQAIDISAGVGGIDIDAADSSAFSVNGIGQTLTLEAVAAGASRAILQANAGTGATAITISADAGGISMDCGSELTLSTNSLGGTAARGITKVGTADQLQIAAAGIDYQLPVVHAGGTIAGTGTSQTHVTYAELGVAGNALDGKTVLMWSRNGIVQVGADGTGADDLNIVDGSDWCANASLVTGDKVVLLYY